MKCYLYKIKQKTKTLNRKPKANEVRAAVALPSTSKGCWPKEKKNKKNKRKLRKKEEKLAKIVYSNTNLIT